MDYLKTRISVTKIGATIGLAGVLALAGPIRSWAQRVVPSAPLASGKLSFDGKATLGDFTGTTESVRGEMMGGGSLGSVRGWVEAPVKTLKTANDRRDRDLNKSMESEKFATIRFDLADVRVRWERGDSAAVTLTGKFTIHGVSREAIFDALVDVEPRGVHLTGQVPMNLKDYAIGGLSKMFGTLKMHPDIMVHLDLLFGSFTAKP